MHWYTDVLKKYAVFEGRATRQEFWMFVLLNFVVSIAVGIIGSIIRLGALSSLYSLAVFIPSLAVGIRRLHDTDKSGWWSLLVLIPIVGWIVLIVFFAQESQAIDNQYGSNSKGVTPSVMSTEPVTKTVVEEKPQEVVINDIPTKEEISSEEKV